MRKSKVIVIMVIIFILLIIFILSGLILQNKDDEYDTIKAYLDDGGDPNVALLYAIDAQDEENVELAIKKGANVNNIDNCSDIIPGTGKCNNPLLIAFEYGNARIAKILIENGSDLNYITEDGESLLMFCARNSDIASTNLLLENAADVNYIASNGESALSVAVLDEKNMEETTLAVVRLLLEYGAVVTERAIDNLEVSAGDYKPYQYSVLQLLIDNIITQNNKTSIPLDLKLQVAFKMKSLDAYLKQSQITHLNDEEFEMFLYAAAADNLSLIKYYVDNYENVNRANKHGTTMLIAAASTGANEVLTFLLKKGADPYIYDCSGESAMVKARKLNQQHTIKLLK